MPRPGSPAFGISPVYRGYAFVPGTIEGAPLAAPLDELLARARSRATAALEIRAAIPSDDVHFRLSERARSGSAFTVAPDELRVLTAVGGGRSVKDVRRQMRLSLPETRALLHGLLAKGLIEATDEPSELAVKTVGAPRWRPARAPADRSVEAPTPAASAPDVGADESVAEAPAKTWTSSSSLAPWSFAPYSSGPFGSGGGGGLCGGGGGVRVGGAVGGRTVGRAVGVASDGAVALGTTATGTSRGRSAAPSTTPATSTASPAAASGARWDRPRAHGAGRARPPCRRGRRRGTAAATARGPARAGSRAAVPRRTGAGR